MPPSGKPTEPQTDGVNGWGAFTFCFNAVDAFLHKLESNFIQFHYRWKKNVTRQTKKKKLDRGCNDKWLTFCLFVDWGVIDLKIEKKNEKGNLSEKHARAHDSWRSRKQWWIEDDNCNEGILLQSSLPVIFELLWAQFSREALNFMMVKTGGKNCKSQEFRLN